MTDHALGKLSLILTVSAMILAFISIALSSFNLGRKLGAEACAADHEP
jgi:hypothetical protein